MSPAVKLALTAVASSALTLVAVRGAPEVKPSSTVKLENARVRIAELTYAPGAVRERGVRRTDQIIVFLDHSSYSRLDPVTGEVTIRRRNPGDVIWHDKGEDAPRLTNSGDRPYRTLVIELE
jgi:hypothetical protein